MLFKKPNKTTEVDQEIKKQIRPADCCSHYKKHPYTLLWKSECWTCTYGDFGIDTGNLTDMGMCRYENEKSETT